MSAPQPRKGDELEQQYDAILLKYGFVIEPDNYFQNEARKDFVALCHKQQLALLRRLKDKAKQHLIFADGIRHQALPLEAITAEIAALTGGKDE